jgi:lipopolysaccharide/colanic/teichoic acid biosynthesis glycosyltransferase
MYKLRTMHHDAEARLCDVLDQNESDGPLFKVSDDPRITKVGKFLRKWSIDEIPQFFNVLRGDMSLVGPRPALPREVAEWDTETADRLRVLPDITGLGQVAGRASTSFDDYKRLDLYYVDNWSLAHDVVIVMKTFRAVVSGRGAF